MKMKLNSFIIWLLLIIAWNYIFPTAPPLYDVIVAILLSLIKTIINRTNKNK